MASGEQHARHGDDLVHALVAQLVQANVDDGVRELKEAAFDLVLGQLVSQLAHHGVELLYRTLTARAMPAHHHTDFLCLAVHLRPPFLTVV